MENCKTCPKTDEIKRLTAKIEEYEKRITEIEKNNSVQEYQYKSIMEALKEMKQDINEIKGKPNKHWDVIVTGLITGAITYIVAKIFH